MPPMLIDAVFEKFLAFVLDDARGKPGGRPLTSDQRAQAEADLRKRHRAFLDYARDQCARLVSGGYTATPDGTAVALTDGTTAMLTRTPRPDRGQPRGYVPVTGTYQPEGYRLPDGCVPVTGRNDQ